EALDSVREGHHDDEEIAFIANKIVRKFLDKRAIRYDRYKAWRQRNPLIFTPIVDLSNELIGFFDIFPLTPEAGNAIIAGKLTERTLTIDDILPAQSIA